MRRSYIGSAIAICVTAVALSMGFSDDASAAAYARTGKLSHATQVQLKALRDQGQRSVTLLVAAVPGQTGPDSKGPIRTPFVSRHRANGCWFPTSVQTGFGSMHAIQRRTGLLMRRERSRPLRVRGRATWYSIPVVKSPWS